jgi:CheY-like chemotaxis protein
MMKLKEKSILLVEDEGLIGLATKADLERFGYRIILAMGGEGAIENISENSDIALVLMDIDLGNGMDGISASRRILQIRDVPIVFVSSHTEPSIVSSTEAITSYGYIVKSSSLTVYDASIKMAYRLFTEKRKTEAFDRYLKTALENASEPIFISDINGNVIYFNKAYLRIQGLSEPEECETRLAKISRTVEIFSDRGEHLDSGSWASTRGLKGEYGTDVLFYVYNYAVDRVLVNQYTFAPVLDDHRSIIGSYVKIGREVEEPDPTVLGRIEGQLKR